MKDEKWLNWTRLLNVECVPSGERSAHLPQGQSGQLVVPAAVGHFRHRSGPPDGAGTDEVYPLADGDVGEVLWRCFFYFKGRWYSCSEAFLNFWASIVSRLEKLAKKASSGVKPLHNILDRVATDQVVFFPHSDAITDIVQFYVL